MSVNKADYEYCIEVERGKYHVVLTKDYRVKYLRGGEEWVDSPPGSKMMIALMAETERKEEEIARLRKALEFYADEDNYGADVHYNGLDEPIYWKSTVENDEGEIAREALRYGD